jgi:ParB/RepB/Spo0J family partition protein
MAASARTAAKSSATPDYVALIDAPGMIVAHATHPLSDFIVWDKNPRRTIDPVTARELGESVLARGQIHNLVARWVGSKLQTIVGNRRLTGLQIMRAEGRIDDGFAINVTIVDVNDTDAALIAMAENISRESMNPIESCEAIRDLSADQMDLRIIGKSVGLKTAEVADMISVANLETEVKDLIATRKRKLDWGKAMARAGMSLRGEVMSAIQKSDTAYVSVQQINQLMRTASLPARNALFDPASVGIAVQSDLVEPDQDLIADKEAFWQAQNVAIAALETQLEREGHAKVVVLRGEAFRDWEYETGENPEGAVAVIEVAADGLVQTHRHQVPKSAGVRTNHTEDEDALFAQDAAELSETSKITITERPPSSRGAEYLASVRSQLAGQWVVQDPRLAMGIALAAMLGERSVGLDWPTHTPAEDDRIALCHAHADAAGDDPLGYVMKLDQPTMTHLFAAAVSVRLRHQVGRKPAFITESIVSRVLAQKKSEGQSLRANWTPDGEFLDTLSVQEIRGLAGELMEPEEIGGDLDHATKVDLVKLLSEAFAAARAGESRYAANTEMKLNAWCPTYVF